MALMAWIDLTDRQIEIKETDPVLLQTWLGGRGLGAALLFERVNASIDAFDPQNCLIFTSGRFNGTSWPTSSRYHVTFKSPATGAYGYANAGGHVGPELRRAGVDGILITGRSSTPVYLEIRDDLVNIQPAEHLWRRSTSEVGTLLTRTAGGHVAAIGAAGENLARIAAIINDGGRAAARGGPGAVMGSKNLKALHVRSDRKNPSVPAEFKQFTKALSKRLLNHPNSAGLMQESTLFLMSIKNIIGDLPAKNHQVAQVPFIDRLDAKAFSAYWTHRKGCAMCAMRCSRCSQVLEGEYESSVEGPEYETADSFGPMCWNAHPEVVIRANQLCNDFGLDTISTGVTIAFAMECHQRGLLNDAELSLEWGDPATILGLIKRIARRQGLGDLLAEGSLGAAAMIGNGAEELAMQVKGIELPRQEPRVAKAFGLGHVTSNRGADHLYGLPAIDLAGNWEIARKLFPEEILPSLMDIADETYKADILIYGEHFCALVDSLGLCKFSTSETYCILPEDLAEGLRMLGEKISESDLLCTGERIVNLERMYNVRHGFTRRQDALPPRFSQEPLPIYSFSLDPATQQVTQSEKPVQVGILKSLDAMLERYYGLRGWDANGVPTAQTLQRLGLARLTLEGSQVKPECWTL